MQQTVSLIAIFIASLLGSLHCAGMCGGLVSFVAGGGTGRFLPQLGYHGGRALSYSILGACAGFLGKELDVAASMSGFERLAALVAGALLIFWGVKGLFSKGAVSLSAGGAESFPYKVIGKLFAFCFGEKKENWPLRALLLGILSGLFPCGWLYAFVAIAAATASPLNGLLVMAVFWAGTVPILICIGGLSQIISRRFSRYVPQVMSVVLIIAGLFSVGTHLGVIGDHSHHSHSSGESEHSHHHHHHAEK